MENTGTSMSIQRERESIIFEVTSKSLVDQIMQLLPKGSQITCISCLFVV